jgi:hypothetical protein
VSQSALAKCPFCGNTPASVSAEITGSASTYVRAVCCGGSWWVECGGCGARGPQYDHENIAVRTWNQRVAS